MFSMVFQDLFKCISFSATLDEFGTFWLFAVFCILGFYMIALVPETKGKSLEIIETELEHDVEGVGFIETFNMTIES